MYGKIFDSIYDGTLVEDWRALITFEQMIVLCDVDGILDMTASSISRRTGIPIEHIKAGIEILENKDPYSRTEDDGGRRIVRLEDHRPWGWYLVNHKKYKGLQDYDTVRAQNRERKRRQRAKAKESRPVTDGHGPSRHTDTDTNKKEHVHFDDFWKAYPKKKDKKKARAIWKRDKLDHHADKILANLAARTDWKDIQFIPLPTTYLNNERWNDETESAPTHKPRKPEVVTDEQRQRDREKSERELAALGAK